MGIDHVFDSELLKNPGNPNQAAQGAGQKAAHALATKAEREGKATLANEIRKFAQKPTEDGLDELLSVSQDIHPCPDPSDDPECKDPYWWWSTQLDVIASYLL